MTPMQLLTLVLSSALTISLGFSTEVDVNGIAINSFQSTGLNDVEVLVQEEAQVINTLIELDNQLEETFRHLSSASGAMEIDVVMTEMDGSNSWIDDKIVVEIPENIKISDGLKEEIKQEIENEIADKLDAIIVDEAVKPKQNVKEEDIPLVDKVAQLYEEEAEAEMELELEQMQEELDKALRELPENGPSEEIDIIVSATNDEDQVEVVDEEIVIVIPASTGSGPRLTDKTKEELEEKVVNDAANALGTIILKDFINPPVPQAAFPYSPRLEGDSQTLQVPVEAVQAQWDAVDTPEVKPALRRERASTTAHTGFEHPIFTPPHWQMPDEQLWTMKLSMLTSISCLTLLVIVGVWTGVRRSRRVILTDSSFRWAEAVEYMDAFPYED
ncbi:hypothetical protein P3T76_008825 [Phytophthora citrophthora]|uniref:Uncharacterized protein n=1 Tax=Phytophthora citrophthora TaxID=4793 RepID=A0AAD9LJI4_9STRA|nr:hypothetical protein P3T76_008825 [Phytophthora citrophthora]